VLANELILVDLTNKILFKFFASQVFEN